MPFVKDSMSLLIESADIDLKHNTNMIMRESTALSNYAALESASQPVIYTAEMVPVVKMDDGYYTEMNFLHPYMKSNGIKSIANALDNVAFVNGLHENAVGLLIESDQSVTDAINAAIDSGSEKKKKAVIAKINKSKAIADKLSEAGIKVKKKCDEGCCGKGCAEEGCENECGTTSPPPQEINEGYTNKNKIEWKYVVPLKSDSTITDIEQRYNISIPTDLKVCIKANNAGSPSLNRLDFGKNKGVCFGGLLSFNKKDDDSIFSYINTFKDKNGKLNMLPFAIDPAGNFFCIKSGKVVFLDHETDTIIPICNSFNTLLSMLY